MPVIVFFFLFVCSVASAQQTQTILVSAAAVEAGEIVPAKEYVGTVQYYAVSKLAAERAGRVDAVLTEEGKAVKKGDTLLVINRDSLNYSINASSARAEQQKYLLDKALRDYERTRTLFADNATSLQRYQDVETDYHVQTRLYNAYSAELNILKEEYKRSVATAPFDGIIVKRYANPGEWVSVGAPIFELASQRVEVEVNVPQAVVTFITPGSETAITVEGKRYSGKIRVLVPQGNTMSRTFPLKIDMNNDKALLGGMDAIVSLPSGNKQSCLMIPRDAVVKRDGRDAVFTVTDGKSSIVYVDVLGYDGARAGIKPDKLKQGDLVITRGSENMAPGRNVTVSEAADSANGNAR